MRRTLVLYSPSIVLFAWAVAWAVGATSDGVMVAALLLEGGAIWLHVKEQIRRYRTGELPPTGKMNRRHEDRRRSYRDFWLVALSVVLVWSAITSVNAAEDAKRATVRNGIAIRQGCRLTKARVKDNMTRLEQAVDYLKDPQNVRENPGLVRTVKNVSIPFNVRQIKVDRQNFPSSCGHAPKLRRDLRRFFKRR